MRARTVGLSFAVWVVATTPADACLCEARQHWGFLAPENGRLPVNATGVAWHKPGDRVSRSDVLAQLSVEIERDGAFHEVPAVAKDVPGFPGVFAIGPEGGLGAGATYRFTDHGDRRSSAPRQVRVTVDGTALVPQTPLLGKAWPLYSETISVPSSGGSCWAAQFVAQALIETALPEPGDRWKDQLLYQTLVDGKAWYGKKSMCHYVPPGRSWRETGEDLLYGSCPDPSDTDRGDGGPGSGRDRRRRGLEPTLHTVRIQAFLPGTDIVLESQTMTVDLSCPGFLEE